MKFGVKYKRPDYKFWQSRAEINQMRFKRIDFVENLTNTMISNDYDEIIYIDETTFNLW